MAKIDANAIEHMISQAFCGGEALSRELRLSTEECDYLRRAYPHFELTSLENSGVEKEWYQVSLPLAFA